MAREEVLSTYTPNEGREAWNANDTELYARDATFTVASEAAMIALSAKKGDIAVRTDLTPDTSFRLSTDDPSLAANWVQISFGGGSVSAASETVAGIAEIATQGETDTGTDDTRIVTPLKLASYSGFPAGSGYTPPWVNQSGAGSIFAAWAYGDPSLHAMLWENAATGANLTATGLGTTNARCVKFRLPKTLAVSHVRVYTQAASTGVFSAAVYPVGSGTSRLWQSGVFNTVSGGWTDITANTPFTINADTDYWMCIGGNTTGTTGIFKVPPPPTQSALWGANDSPIAKAALGTPVAVTIAVTSGSFPSTLPSITASASGYPAFFILEGTAS